MLAAVIVIASMPALAALPLAWVASRLLLPWYRCLRTCRCPSYRRDPSSCRIAIIGAGWGGLAIAARLRALGVPFEGFEALNDVGGTWHESFSYPGLTLHTPARGAEFSGFPYPSDGAGPAAGVPDSRPSAADLRECTLSTSVESEARARMCHAMGSTLPFQVVTLFVANVCMCRPAPLC